MLYFGWEALLPLAVELAFSYVSARTAVRVVREGWLTAAVRLTWKPMLGALLCAVLLGAVMDHTCRRRNGCLKRFACSGQAVDGFGESGVWQGAGGGHMPWPPQ